jgi:rhamnosyltransferase
MVNIIGVVILYQPDNSFSLEYINSYLPALNKLLLYDNSDAPSPQLEQLIKSQNSTKLLYHYFGENAGISKRLNQAADYAIANGYDYLLMMDQDSGFKDQQFNFYLDKIYKNEVENVAQFGVNCQPEFTPLDSVPRKVISLITSGSVLNLKYFNSIGCFNEELFIDYVDAEFSYRVIEKGFYNLLFSDIILNHRIGYLKMGRSLKNFKLTPRILHSPIRIYYILRNGLYLLFRKNKVRGAARADLLQSMRILKNDFIYHSNLAAVYSNAFWAVFDFLRKKMGKK